MLDALVFMARYSLFKAFGVLHKDAFLRLVEGLETIVENLIPDKQVNAGNETFYVRKLTAAELKEIVAA